MERVGIYKPALMQAIYREMSSVIVSLLGQLKTGLEAACSRSDLA